MSATPVSRSEAPAEVTIRLSNISKYYAGVTALENVTVEFYANEVHAVLGENGAGKSTLMKIIAGTIQPDTGQIEFGDRIVSPLSPDSAVALGIAISFQHPAILGDLTVLENFQLALPPSIFEGKSATDLTREALAEVGLDIPLNVRADQLNIAQKHLLEIAKALAIRPKLLILDEPTSALGKDATDMLFDRIRQVASKGTAVLYITHRMAEVRQIAQRITILRDGQFQGVMPVDEISDADVLNMIVGRTLTDAFPPKAKGDVAEIDFAVEGLSGDKFTDVSFAVPHGKIIGVAGVEGNGQSELMRAIAGLQPSEGRLELKGQALSYQDLQKQTAFMPSDRLTEGIASSLTVRENASFGALDKFAQRGIVRHRKEMGAVGEVFRSLSVKAGNSEASILSLSGGNQQKVVMARALLSEPGLVVADEPTQGVDVGARFEIYSILRELSQQGIPIVVNSSDSAELEGLCDEVIVLSRGRIVAHLTGDEVREEKIVSAAVNAHGTEVGHKAKAAKGVLQAGKWRQFLQSDLAPVVPLSLVVVLISLYVFGQNASFFSAYNVSNLLLLATPLGFIALGQTVALLTGGIDLSVGPLSGFLVVVASFFINDGDSAALMLLGFFLIFGSGFLVGAINGVLIRFGDFTPISATLTLFIGIQGFSFLLREGVGGFISYPVIDAINTAIGPIPVAFIVMVLLAIVGEYMLRKTRMGWQLKAVGSNEEAARRIGVRVDRVFIAGYILTSLLTALGAVMLMAQIGVGDPRQGTSYTLTSIAAVVLGGTSLRGGRGSFVGTILGAILLTVVLSAVAFLGLSQAHQYFFQGALMLVAALIFSAASQSKGASGLGRSWLGRRKALKLSSA
ncbi:ribose transport system ATP-binding protein [Salinihabitans flavidus]|uniref:Ribose transport system ATP-binding protein n=1 Tax=Salinihabitans flavidus TaxID=569882 RepID=A0A1H8PBQ7_9RHOB|nr:ATP-binding cassette domain-containing protein [Salinihabitans flavidus]SEO39058.1 ribose transport system ATP-binding protein [Salinihabitans flavidus]